jgi:hypothetical protein
LIEVCCIVWQRDEMIAWIQSFIKFNKSDCQTNSESNRIEMRYQIDLERSNQIILNKLTSNVWDGRSSSYFSSWTSLIPSYC